METRELLRLGVEGLSSHRLRSLLTTLGIIFGVAAVISMLSIGEGAKRQALAQYELLGINNIHVIDDPPKEREEEGEGRANASRGLSLADVEAAISTNPLLLRAVPSREIDEEAQYGTDRVQAKVVGTTSNYAAAMNIRPSRGRFFNQIELDHVKRVCALGAGIKRDLFHFKDAVGERVKIGRDWYTVIGVLDRMAVSGADAQSPVRDSNRDIYVPISNVMHRIHRDELESQIDRMVVTVANGDRIREAANILASMLARRHNGVEDYRIIIPEELMRQKRATQRIFNIVMGAIAGISLLVGGIGIMNIMLASILERTREIGVRRAMGATQREIMTQFLLEAVAVSFLGGVLGIAVGFGLTQAIASYAGWPTVVAPWSVLLAFGVSATVGVVFGFYPARRAARLRPIECLRYE